MDIAYKLRENYFNGNTTIELELIGVRLPIQLQQFFASPPTPSSRTFAYKQRQYTCGFYKNGIGAELRIKNPEGKVLVMQPGHIIGLLGNNRQDAKEVDISQPQYDSIIQAALQALSVSSAEL